MAKAKKIVTEKIVYEIDEDTLVHYHTLHLMYYYILNEVGPYGGGTIDFVTDYFAGDQVYATLGDDTSPEDADRFAAKVEAHVKKTHAFKHLADLIRQGVKVEHDGSPV